MGMVLEVFAVGPYTLERIMADPPLVWQLIAPDDPDRYAEAVADTRTSTTGVFGRLFGRKPAAPAAPTTPLDLHPDETSIADLDKSWHGIDYLLTKREWSDDAPMNFLVEGGTEIGDLDVGYGPARYLRPGEVEAISRALAKVSDAQLEAGFDPEDMMAKEIYPEIWSHDRAEDDSLAYLMENLATLRRGLASATAAGYGIVMVLQ